MQDIHFKELRIFENYHMETVEEGHVVMTTKVTPSSLNYYGNTHGGYLFALSDQVSGLVVRTTGFESVTLQSNINYLKAGHLDETLTIEGQIVHNGRTTKVIDVLIRNNKEEILTKSSFTMFVTGKRENRDKVENSD
ncbi:PaaI family thioesterase [Streptococcus sp. CSL10205-OR2]|uniref:PaaI family thioesterase n=1 Tax=Streptococcus sp. CSL10205-OR2 TaxID=2980558 RepID=UPI0021D8F42F|nr:PaaI family thioesterase [Streptococcus sp. CSL10205-OR2]MCU9533684.1 PaaI family thioesterase [Streptococcus sp. CSL10205-OR2]